MSHSPTEPSDPAASGDYHAGWQAMQRLVAEGHSWSGYERHCCFLNTGQGRFADVSAVSGLDLSDDGRGVAVVDWDLDGRLDLWVTNRTGPSVRFLRNELETGHHYLAVRLVGQTCNRDAIGARVELYVQDPDAPLRVKTLRAGEGFLAQSSKWLHFGLGAHEAIDRIVVRWPGGAAETIRGLRADRRYEIVQGTGQAQEWSPPARASAASLAVADAEPPEPARGSRTVLFRAVRPEVAALPWQDLDGRTRSRGEFPGPLLVLLWSGDCQTCLQELAELSRHARRFRARGLEVLALNIDGLSVGESGDSSGRAAKDLETIVRRHEFAFPVGRATAGAVAALEDVHYDVFRQFARFPVPVSFLLDEDDRVLAVYKGPAGAAQVLDDLALRDASPAVVRAAAVPFDGRWLHEMGTLQEEPLTIADLWGALRDRPEIAAGLLALILVTVGFLVIRQRRSAPADGTRPPRIGMFP